jgi:arginine repressor
VRALTKTRGLDLRNKPGRQDAILRLIGGRQIASQEELKQLLAKVG